MKITVHSTTTIVELETQSGAKMPARMWEGVTDSGTPVHCFITRISPTIPKDDPRNEEFARELKECAAPTVPGIPLRMIL